MTWPALHVSRSFDHDVAVVSAVAGDPQNLPAWAAGLSSGIRLEGGRWVATSPMGDVEVAFTGPVELGVLDHDVTLPDGSVVHNPMRVVANDRGSEVVFTLFRRDGTSEADVAADAEIVRGDLDRLAELVEASCHRRGAPHGSADPGTVSSGGPTPATGCSVEG